MSETVVRELAELLRALIWPAAIIGILFVARSKIGPILDAVAELIKNIKRVRFPGGVVEAGRTDIKQTKPKVIRNGRRASSDALEAPVESFLMRKYNMWKAEGKDEIEIRRKDLAHRYRAYRKVFLVHKVYPTTSPPWKEVVLSLSDNIDPFNPDWNPEYNTRRVNRVEYFLGTDFEDEKTKSNIFETTDKGKSFEIRVQAYGEFLCTALIFFENDVGGLPNPILVERYVDFPAAPAQY